MKFITTMISLMALNAFAAKQEANTAFSCLDALEQAQRFSLHSNDIYSPSTYEIEIEGNKVNLGEFLEKNGDRHGNPLDPKNPLVKAVFDLNEKIITENFWRDQKAQHTKEDPLDLDFNSYALVYSDHKREDSVSPVPPSAMVTIRRNKNSDTIYLLSKDIIVYRPLPKSADGKYLIRLKTTGESPADLIYQINNKNELASLYYDKGNAYYHDMRNEYSFNRTAAEENREIIALSEANSYDSRAVEVINDELVKIIERAAKSYRYQEQELGKLNDLQIKKMANNHGTPKEFLSSLGEWHKKAMAACMNVGGKVSKAAEKNLRKITKTDENSDLDRKKARSSVRKI